MNADKYGRFKKLMEEEMVKHEAKDKASGYQMYHYPDFNNLTRDILSKASSTEEAILLFQKEDPDGWYPGFLQQLADYC